ncbi:DUF2189 domain-containing protein [Stakelama saccharophila]|uniref:DUF2189 domain-containing protein n=1 Tax=Stakelama saccharophila TaxID=3075605 RepID=A0ABZ0B672_9SPHN|nr:DUF2189 domain-containing protein [Stakelama sp. W311]WNO52742.1 DUF2189 domain-containing protein [Stakelama sp. W311]
MAITREMAMAAAAPRRARIRRIGTDDLRASLRDGWADFRDKRGDIILLGLLYPLVGFLAVLASLGSFHLELLFPVFAGLTLLGPLVATGFYEIARRREAGDPAGWSHFFDVTKSPSFPAMMGIGGGLFLLFGLWLLAAAGIWVAFLGPDVPDTPGGLMAQVFGTPAGWQMMVVGNLVGLGFAVVVLAVSTVALPMLVDREATAAEAVLTSVAAFRANSGVMLRWGLTVAVVLILGAIPVLIGLAVALPVLGYATWHLYTRVVERDGAAPVA